MNRCELRKVIQIRMADAIGALDFSDLSPTEQAMARYWRDVWRGRFECGFLIGREGESDAAIDRILLAMRRGATTTVEISGNTRLDLVQTHGLLQDLEGEGVVIRAGKDGRAVRWRRVATP
jgi:hypothetical protein